MKAPVLIFAALLLTVPAAHSAPALDDGLTMDLTMPPGKRDRFQHAEFFCWLPDPQRPVRAVIIHQHGCGNVVADKHPPVTLDFHWRALARKHNCALVVPHYQVAGECADWNDPDSGSERALFAALADFARRSGRAELAEAPWVLWGHSGGSSWSAQMILRHSKRVLAASFRGGCHRQFGAPEFRARFGPVARDLPMLFVWGKRESVPASSHHVSWEPMNTMYRELRAQGGMVARVIDPRSEHGCDDSRLLVIPFFDAVLTARLTQQAMNGALVDLASRDSRPFTEINLRDPTLAWLPSAELARLWREFSETGTLHPSNPLLTPPVLHATREANGLIRLNWRIEPALDGGLRALRIYREGKLWKELGVKTGDFLATGRDSPPEGLSAASLIDDTIRHEDDPAYSITFLDAAGNESPVSTPAQGAR